MEKQVFDLDKLKHEALVEFLLKHLGEDVLMVRELVLAKGFTEQQFNNALQEVRFS